MVSLSASIIMPKPISVYWIALRYASLPDRDDAGPGIEDVSRVKTAVELCA
jgi:hypothetical protein